MRIQNLKYPLLRTQRCQRFFLFRDDVPSADDIYLCLPYIYSNARCEVRNAIQISGVVFLAMRDVCRAPFIIPCLLVFSSFSLSFPPYSLA